MCVCLSIWTDCNQRSSNKKLPPPNNLGKWLPSNWPFTEVPRGLYSSATIAQMLIRGYWGQSKRGCGNSKVPESHRPRGTTLREALRGNLPLRGVSSRVMRGSAGFCKGHLTPRVVTLCLDCDSPDLEEGSDTIVQKRRRNSLEKATQWFPWRAGCQALPLVFQGLEAQLLRNSWAISLPAAPFTPTPISLPRDEPSERSSRQKKNRKTLLAKVFAARCSAHILSVATPADPCSERYLFCCTNFGWWKTLRKVPVRNF